MVINHKELEIARYLYATKLRRLILLFCKGYLKEPAFIKLNFSRLEGSEKV